MDYCTLADVLGATGTGTNPLPRPTPAPYDDSVQAQAITHASRAIDRLVTQSDAPTALDYFLQAALTDELHDGVVTKHHNILVFAHKPSVTAVAAFAYRQSPRDPWTAVESTALTVSGYKITAWIGTPMPREPVMIKATYTGGLATTSTGLPADLQRAAIVLAARYYKEMRSGLGDVIGMPQTGELIYTKAVPTEVLQLLAPYTRPIPW